MIFPSTNSKFNLKNLVSILGFKEIKDVKTGFDVLVIPSKINISVQKIFTALKPFGATLDENTITLEGTNISVKNINRFKKVTLQNKGIKTEERFFNLVKEILKVEEPVTFIFEDWNKKRIEFKDIVDIKSVGSSGTLSGGTGTGKKADVVFINKNFKTFPISLKGKKGDQLASADTFWRDSATKVINFLLNKEEIKLSKITSDTYKIDPAVAIEANPEEIEFAAFGNDILTGGGAILKGEFLAKDFNFVQEHNYVTVNCDKIFSSVEDFNGKDKVWIQLRNDASRGSANSKFWKGIRIIIVQEKNLGSNIIRIPKHSRYNMGIA